MNTNKVGTLTFDKRQLDIYSSLDEPLFSARDVADMVGYSAGNTWNMLGMVETDEKLILPMVVAGQSRSVSFVTESGLYNILAQSRKPLARKWRRLISDELINLRKQRNYNSI